jgi:hypothetical protein
LLGPDDSVISGVVQDSNPSAPANNVTVMEVARSEYFAVSCAPCKAVLFRDL